MFARRSGRPTSAKRNRGPGGLRSYLQDHRGRRPGQDADLPGHRAADLQSQDRLAFPVERGEDQEMPLPKGPKRATLEFPFRSSSTHPLTRVNPQTSVGPGLPVVYYDFAEDADTLDILMAPKGSGSENMSKMQMFYPAHGVKALKKFVLDTVIETGANPCPPGIIGVGIGGTADLVMKLAKDAILRPVGQRNSDPEIAKMEEELEEAINATGRGPMGLGGDISTLAVHIETAYTHITQNPVAVNTQCWPARRSRAIIQPDGTVEYGY